MTKRRGPLILTTLLMLPLAAWAESSLKLNYSAPPDPFAASQEKPQEKPPFTLAPQTPRITLGTRCQSEYCTQRSAPPDLLKPERIHRTDRRRQSDAFSTDQGSDGSLFISGHW